MRGWLLAIWMGLTGVHAHALCQKDNHYDLICLRNHYQKPSSQWHPPTVDEGVVWLELAPIVIDDKPPTPIAILGRQLFFETALSSDGQVACVNCHDPQHGFFLIQELYRLVCMAGRAVAIASL